MHGNKRNRHKKLHCNSRGSSSSWFPPVAFSTFSQAARRHCRCLQIAFHWVCRTVTACESKTQMRKVSIHRVFTCDSYPKQLLKSFSYRLLSVKRELEDLARQMQQPSKLLYIFGLWKPNICTEIIQCKFLHNGLTGMQACNCTCITET